MISPSLSHSLNIYIVFCSPKIGVATVPPKCFWLGSFGTAIPGVKSSCFGIRE